MNSYSHLHFAVSISSKISLSSICIFIEEEQLSLGKVNLQKIFYFLTFLELKITLIWSMNEVMLVSLLYPEHIYDIPHKIEKLQWHSTEWFADPMFFALK